MEFIKEKEEEETLEQELILSHETHANSILDLKGVGPITHEKLIANGYTTILSIAGAASRILSSKCDIREKIALVIISDARRYLVGQELIPASKIIEERKILRRYKTGIIGLDSFIRGGLESKSLVEFYGEFATGKTQICFQIIVNTLKNNKTGVVVFIDTENTFRPERILELFKKEKIRESELNRIFVYRAYSSGLQLIALEKIKKIHGRESPVLAVFIDSITAQFRAEYIGRGFLSERQQLLNSHLRDLLRFATENDCLIVITNQVQANRDSMYGRSIKRVGGNVLAHASTYRFFLRKGKANQRVIKLVDSREFEEAEFTFKISKDDIK